MTSSCAVSPGGLAVGVDALLDLGFVALKHPSDVDGVQPLHLSQGDNGGTPFGRRRKVVGNGCRWRDGKAGRGGHGMGLRW
jgi:hypothetical protein